MKLFTCLIILFCATFAQAVPVDFKLTKPNATVVLVAGEFNEWDPLPMTANSNGEWHLQIDLEPGEYAYKFIVDEVWLFDPANDARKEVDGNSNSKLTVVSTVASPTQTKPSTPPAAVKADARDWKDSITGKTISAQLVDMEGNIAVLKMNGQLFRVRKERLRPVDQEYIAKWEANRPVAAQGDEDTASNEASPFNAALAPEQMHIFSIPMRERMRYQFKPRGFDPSQTPENMRIAIALPKDFDPNNLDNKIAIISQTADGDASSVNHMREYYTPVTKAGWICIAIDIDGDEAKRKDWVGLDDRWVLIYSALRQMHEAWPDSKRWNYGAFGYSGGAGYSNYIGAQLVKDHYDLHAIWAGGSNYRDHHFSGVLPPSKAYFRAMYFLSWGRHDQIAPAHKQEEVKYWGDENFRKFRYETFDGGHTIYQPHLEAALIWFNK